MLHPLDNPVWNALVSGNAALSSGTDRVRYFPPEVCFFAGLAQNDDAHFAKLYNTIPFAGTFGIMTPVERQIPGPWNVLRRVDVFQMVCEKPAREVRSAQLVIELGPGHVSAMLALTKLTNPGPFSTRTIEMGHYRGIFEGDQLVAMAGQRLHPRPYAEISAVCTHPDHLGKGYAAQLLTDQVKRIITASDIPFLNVLTTNARAIGVYRSLGFQVRKPIFIYVIQKK